MGDSGAGGDHGKEIYMNLLQTLMECQRVENEIAQIENELRGSQVRKKLLHARNYIVNSQTNYKQMENDVNELYAVLEDLTQHYEVNRAKSEAESIHYEAADEESDLADVQDMQRESHDIATALAKNEQDLLSLIKRLANIDQEMKKMAANLPRARQDYTKIKAIYDKELETVQAKTEPLKGKLEEMEGQLPPELLGKYKSARQHAANPVVPLENGRCSGCHMELASAGLTHLKNQGIAECENCGRLVYVKE
jgi:predicted  nucleic acid-binding Zn-ribbon protein